MDYYPIYEYYHSLVQDPFHPSDPNVLVNSAALRQGSNVVAAGGKDSVGPSDTGSTHPVILQRDIAASPSGACSPTASARLVAAASPRRISTTNVARDPRTGKGIVLIS